MATACSEITEEALGLGTASASGRVSVMKSGVVLDGIRDQAITRDLVQKRAWLNEKLKDTDNLLTCVAAIEVKEMNQSKAKLRRTMNENTKHTQHPTPITYSSYFTHILYVPLGAACGC